MRQFYRAASKWNCLKCSVEKDYMGIFRETINMEINKILKADILDIIFEGRNKSYGAYDLRKTYRKRMFMSVMGMMSLMLLAFFSYVVANKVGSDEEHVMVVTDVSLKALIEPEKKPELLPPPPKVEPPKVEMTKFNPPVIVKDDKVRDDEMPPEQDKLDDTRIGDINQEGIKDEGITAPPVDYAGKGIVDAPKPDVEDPDKIFIGVEIESNYPGGTGAWQRYLNKTFSYPDLAVQNDIQGTVVVQFIVDREGNVSEVEALSGPTNGGLREEAIRVIKKSGRWEPAVQNGRKVKSYKKQPITFRLDSQ